MTETTSRQHLDTFDDLLEATLQEDEQFAERWKVTEVVARFGAHVFEERTDQGVSQSDLAAAVGTGQPNISRIEHGAGNPTLETMAKIARALDVDVSSLLRSKDASGASVEISIEDGGRGGRPQAHERAKPWKNAVGREGRILDWVAGREATGASKMTPLAS